MKITKVEIIKANLALKEPFVIATMNIQHAQNVIIKIHTDEDMYGIGEASPFWRICGETQGINLAAARDLAKLIIGKDPLDIESRIADMQAYLANNTTILSAFDMALYDLAGKAAGMPIYKLLGGNKTALITDVTIGINDPAYVAAKAKEYIGKGFHAIKVKLGTTMDKDLARIRAIREAIGNDIPIRIDANQGWDYNTALATLRALEPFVIQYCEQPVEHWNHSALRRIRQFTTIPIMADESLFDHKDAFRLCRDECCDYLNIKLSKSGGIRNALNICAVGESAGIQCMIGCMMESRLGLTAAAHFAAARRNVVFYDLDSALLLDEDPVTGGIIYEADVVQLPDSPGLGADFDPSWLRTMESLTV